MSHSNLWAPWRLGYILGSKSGDTDRCFICAARQSDQDRENLVVARGKHCLVLLNRFPYNNGHLLVAPASHKAVPNELFDDEMLELMQLMTHMTDRLGELMRPDGYNIGLNLGRVAGAGLPGHLHWHIVPRWNGDTNFMSVVSETRVINQSLEALYDLLSERMSEPESSAKEAK